MLKIRRGGLWIFIMLLVSAAVQAQTTPFFNDIQAFKKKDSIQFPPRHSILFIGSSSFTRWTNLQEDFPEYPVLNRGFGGSALPELILYAKDIVLPYHPKQIIIYCGENDLAAADSVTAVMVLKRFGILFNIIRNYYPNIPIVFISIKPSPSRQRLMPKMAAANKLIKQFLLKKRNTAFVDVYHKMLKPAGAPRDDLFIEDNLHMNKKGYAIWQKAIKPYLLN